MAARLKLLLLFEESFLESAFLHLFAASALGSSSTDLHFDPAGCFFSVLTLASFDSCSGKQLNCSGASSEMVLLSSTCPLSSGPLASAEACKASKAKKRRTDKRRNVIGMDRKQQNLSSKYHLSTSN
jgi:hypothetical protein